MSLPRIAALVVALCIPLSAHAQQSAPTKQQAIKAHMRDGISELRDGDLEAAHSAFQAAWQIRRLAAIAASLADVEMQLGRYRDAAEHWEFYLRRLPSGRAEARAEGQAGLAECRKHIGQLSVTVDQAGATVFVDGEKVGESPLSRALWVDPGEHALSARLGDLRSKRTSITVSAGDAKEVALVLDEPAPRPAASRTETLSEPATPSPSEPAEPRDGNDARGRAMARTWVAVGGAALTVAAVGVGVFYTLQASELSDDRERLYDRLQRDFLDAGGDPELVEANAFCGSGSPMAPARCGDLSEALDEEQRARTIGIGGFVGGGLFALGTVLTYALWPGEGDGEKEASVRVAPWGNASGRARGLQVSGSF